MTTRGALQLGPVVLTGRWSEVTLRGPDLERALGAALLKPAGRGVALTDAGFAAMRQAEQIFQLGEQLPAAVRDAVGAPVVRLVVGISDDLPKLAVHSLMQPVMQEPNLRLLCLVDEFEDLLGDLALHRLDVVLADRAAPPNPNLKVYSHLLDTSPLAWYAPAPLQAAARRGFPQSLSQVPVLLPTHHAAVRARIDQWFERMAIRPQVVGEFVHDPGRHPEHDHVVFTLEGGQTVTFNDVRRFGAMDLWPTEDYHLAISHVETQVPEADLFAGIREG